MKTSLSGSVTRIVPLTTPRGFCPVWADDCVGVVLKKNVANGLALVADAAAVGVKVCPVDTVAATAADCSGRPSRRTAASTTQLAVDCAGAAGPEVLL